ncbi:hypothetical protein ACFL6U_06330 [Planctomycetota bacterium]
MVQSAKTLLGSRVWCQDGPIGIIKDILFSDSDWTLTYMVVAKHRWLPLGKIVLEPAVISCPQGQGKVMSGLTRKGLGDCPPASEHLPLAAQKKLDKKIQRVRMTRTSPDKMAKADVRIRSLVDKMNPHLHSMKEIIGYGIQAKDGEIGTVGDACFDPSQWNLKGVKVKNGRAGIKNNDFISTDLISEIRCRQQQVTLVTAKEGVLHALKSA